MLMFICVMCIFLCVPLNVHAWGIVHDPINYVELVATYNKLLSQYQLLANTYKNAKQQLGAINQLKQNMQGHYGFGGLYNGSDSLLARQWSPESWQDALQGLSGGNPQRYQQLKVLYEKRHPRLSADQYRQSSNIAKAGVYKNDVLVNQAAMVNATYGFDTIKSHLDTIHRLSQQIDQSPNAKAALDLNARLLAEVAYIQTQELKMQVLLNQQVGQQMADNIAAKSDAAQFNRLSAGG